MKVDPKTLKNLEWQIILKHLSEHATNTMGKELCLELLPVGDNEDVIQQLKETSTAKQVIQSGLNPPLGGFFDIRESLNKAQKGLILDGKEFLDIRSTLTTSKNIKSFFNKYEEEFPRLYNIASYIIDHRYLLENINKCFDQNGNLLDTASTKLKQLKDSLKDQTKHIKSQLAGILNSYQSKFLQEHIYTIRNERYVFPIKAEHKSDFPGIVHDSSASGATIFIEPRSIVDINNKIKETEFKIDHEIQRIFADLTSKFAKDSDYIRITMDLVAKIDFIFAKAKYSFALDASEPEINLEKRIYLKNCKHPILIKNLDKVIPNNIEINDQYSNLIISGSNTGGKTVLLKTTGLCILMAASGMHIPADHESTIFLFDSIFAEIGENQNIEENLSTYSAHINNIINIINNTNNNSLVLLDELCAGTDPAEGTAIAQSLLEYLNKINASTMITTHYGGLKTLAHSHTGFRNASVEFDMETLRPTYRLLMDIPGQSNATTIALNLGLNKEIVSRANDIYDSNIDDFSKALNELQQKQIEIEKKLQEAKSKYTFAEELTKELELKNNQFDETKSRTLKAFKKELSKDLTIAKREVIKVINELEKDKSTQSAKKAHTEIANIERGLKNQADTKLTKLQKTEEVKQVDWSTIKVGDLVFIEKLNQNAILLSLPDEKNKTKIQVGLMKTTVNKKDLSFPKNQKQPLFEPKFKNQDSLVMNPRRTENSIRLDLRGERRDDALFELEYYLDRAAVSNLSPVCIIHGHGSGALQKAVRAFLNESVYVKNYRPGEPSEGGEGVTIVELK